MNRVFGPIKDCCILSEAIFDAFLWDASLSKHNKKYFK